MYPSLIHLCCEVPGPDQVPRNELVIGQGGGVLTFIQMLQQGQWKVLGGQWEEQCGHQGIKRLLIHSGHVCCLRVPLVGVWHGKRFGQ